MVKLKGWRAHILCQIPGGRGRLKTHQFLLRAPLRSGTWFTNRDENGPLNVGVCCTSNWKALRLGCRLRTDLVPSNREEFDNAKLRRTTPPAQNSRAQPSTGDTTADAKPDMSRRYSYTNVHSFLHMGRKHMRSPPTLMTAFGTHLHVHSLQ